MRKCQDILWDSIDERILCSLDGSILWIRNGSSTMLIFLMLRDLVAALWDKKLAFRTRERRKFWVSTDGPQRKEKKTSSEAVLRLNSASEKESVLLKEDQTDL
ncbi:hypothetical protein TNCV_4199641 [Trichonephila clavipes]|uniref:Uncharacterized protein n=1 Tax=Trichonephila clavipes TaxID=2585209 RepID=A0A8X7BHS1_TRICX|nr:hypothetical protein TNCV_4199641 [Trichonephila clavipes]